MQNSVPDHERISPTAKLVAFWRKSSDLPYSKEVAELFRVDEAMNSYFKGRDASSEILATYAELRYKSIETLLRELNIKQILEFGSGISLRGLAMTEDPMVTYVETDLPALTAEKREILRKIMQKYGIMHRQNLHIQSANILNEADIERLLGIFRPRDPIAVVHEGLFSFLTQDERRIATRNIHRVLARFGGVWITPDLDTKADLKIADFDNPKDVSFVDSMASVTGRNVSENSFADDDEMFDFFAGEGFDVEVQSLLSARTELSMYRTKPMPDTVRLALKQLRLWVLRLAERTGAAHT